MYKTSLQDTLLFFLTTLPVMIVVVIYLLRAGIKNARDPMPKMLRNRTQRRDDRAFASLIARYHRED